MGFQEICGCFLTGDASPISLAAKTHWCIAHKKKMLLLPSNPQLEPPLPLNSTFPYRIRSIPKLCSSLQLSVWTTIWRGRYGLHGTLPWVRQRDSSFRALLRGGPRRWKLKMWFQALEFVFFCTEAKHILDCCSCRRSKSSHQFFLNDLVARIVRSSEATAVYNVSCSLPSCSIQ